MTLKYLILAFQTFNTMEIIYRSKLKIYYFGDVLMELLCKLSVTHSLGRYLLHMLYKVTKQTKEYLMICARKYYI